MHHQGKSEMELPSVGNPLLHAATLASERQKAQEQTDPPAAPNDPPPGLQAPDAPTPGAPIPNGRTREELEHLADEVLAVFEDSPDRLNDLVATLKRLERSTTP